MTEDNIREAEITIGTSPVQITNELTSGILTALNATNSSINGQQILLKWTGLPADIHAGGILLTGKGSTFSESWDGYFKPSPKAVYAIADGAGASLVLQVRVRP